MIETDSPYLTPKAHKGKKNQPANLIEIAKKIAIIKDMPLNVIQQTTHETTCSFFNLI